jgi:Domain of unknown function (DUF397)
MSGIWRKSSYSGSGGGNCAEVASTPSAVLIRDSKDPDGPRLVVCAPAWQEFTDRMRTGA